jgi:hypothetical protein
MNKDELIAHMTAESAPGTPMMSTRSRRCSPTTLCIPTTPLRERLPTRGGPQSRSGKVWAHRTHSLTQGLSRTRARSCT